MMLPIYSENLLKMMFSYKKELQFLREGVFDLHNYSAHAAQWMRPCIDQNMSCAVGNLTLTSRPLLIDHVYLCRGTKAASSRATASRWVLQCY